jgi:hypothetical protein
VSTERHAFVRRIAASLVAVVGVLLAVPSAAAVAAEPANAAVAAGSPDGAVRPAEARCRITRGSHGGGRMCDKYVRDYTWADGRQETFIVGWDYAAWHIWQRWAGDTEWSGWASLGGHAQEYSWSGMFIASEYPLIIMMFGTDGEKYCKQFFPTYGGWGVNWFSCNY